MSLLSFFGRRILSGLIAKVFSGFLIKRFKMSPGAASLIFVVITELLARSSEQAVPDSKLENAAKKAKK